MCNLLQKKNLPVNAFGAVNFQNKKQNKKTIVQYIDHFAKIVSVNFKRKTFNQIIYVCEHASLELSMKQSIHIEFTIQEQEHTSNFFCIWNEYIFQ